MQGRRQLTVFPHRLSGLAVKTRVMKLRLCRIVPGLPTESAARSLTPHIADPRMQLPYIPAIYYV